MTSQATVFLDNAPPGEYYQCAAALASILGSEESLQPARDSTLVSWNEKQCTAVKIDDHYAIICEEAKISEGEYLDPVTNKVFGYNFETRQTQPATSMEPSSSPLRDSIQNAINDYLTKSYKEKAAGGAYISGSSIKIVLRSSAVSLSNYRTGLVTARYTLSDSGNLSGRIQSFQHFFENGNAVCQFGADLKGKTIGMDDPDSTASSVIKAISAFEDNWYTEQNQALDSLSQEGFQQLRRERTIRNVRIEWYKEFTTGGGMGIPGK